MSDSSDEVILCPCCLRVVHPDCPLCGGAGEGFASDLLRVPEEPEPCDSLPWVETYAPTAADWQEYAAWAERAEAELPPSGELTELGRQLVDSIMLETAKSIAREVPAAAEYLGIGGAR